MVGPGPLPLDSIERKAGGSVHGLPGGSRRAYIEPLCCRVVSFCKAFIKQEQKKTFLHLENLSTINLFTHIFSVAMNGSSSAILLSMTFSYTTRPLVTLLNMIKQASAVRKASGRVMRRLALHDNVSEINCIWREPGRNILRCVPVI